MLLGCLVFPLRTTPQRPSSYFIDNLVLNISFSCYAVLISNLE